AVHLLRAEDALRYFAPVAGRPGFPAAVARTLEELRMNDVGPAALRRLGASGADLAALAERVQRELAAARLADRALVFEAARGALPDARLPAAMLFLDVPLASVRERELVAALARRAPEVLATAPRGDARTLAPPAASPSTGWRSSSARPPTTASIWRRPSGGRPSRRSSRAARGGPIPAGARSWRSSPARPRSSRRGASPSTSRSRRSPIPTGRR